MKKTTFTILAVIIAGFSTKTFAQAKKHVLFEHFTNACCSPCAAQNPVFDTAVLTKNLSYVKHCEYHTDWPGTDPMNAYDATDVNGRVTYYGITGVPKMEMQGNKGTGSPANFTAAMAKDIASIPSPLQVKVKETSNGTARQVKVTVYTLSPLPSGGTYKVRTAVCESVINYATAPGSNGEKIFKDVFRKMLPNTTGTSFTPATTYVDSTVFTYSYNLDLITWDTTKIYTIAWVQEETSKEVINCGSSLDPDLKWRAICKDEPIKISSSGNAVSFAPVIYNLGNSAINLRIKFTKIQPANWTASLQANSGTVTDSVDLAINAGDTVAINLSVTPGLTPAIGEYVIIITDMNDPTTLPLRYSYLVNSGITDLIINNDVAWGDGLTTYSTTSFQNNYINGLNYAGNTSFAVTKLNNFVNITKFNKLGNIQYLYFNVGWSFPSLTIDNTNAFKQVLNNGGNMFISGQDVGWDTWDLTNGGNGNTITQSFYTTYLKSSWVADGDATNSSITTADVTDLVFGAVSSSSVVNVYGSGTNGAYFYPDQINAATGGKAVFQYSSSKVAGVRSTSGAYKTVTLGCSLEQISDTNVRKTIIKLSHDWFHGILNSIEYDQSMQAMMGQNFPNPADNSTTIVLSDISEDMVLQVSDITGHVILEQPVSKNTTTVVLNTVYLSEGLYYYRLLNENAITIAKPMQIMH